MSSELWTAVDRYISDQLVDHDSALEAAQQASAAAGLPPIAVTPAQGKLLALLARAIGARQILELGTLGGYSTILLARALPPDGHLVTIEADPRYAAVAHKNLERAGVNELVELRQGPALEVLPELAAERTTPFDFVFIDADKPNTPRYFSAVLEMVRPGGLIIADNVVRDGGLADPDSGDPAAQGGRALHELLHAEQASRRRASATTIQTVGAKGYDGFTLALVTAGVEPAPPGGDGRRRPGSSVPYERRRRRLQ